MSWLASTLSTHTVHGGGGCSSRQAAAVVDPSSERWRFGRSACCAGRMHVQPEQAKWLSCTLWVHR